MKTEEALRRAIAAAWFHGLTAVQEAAVTVVRAVPKQYPTGEPVHAIEYEFRDTAGLPFDDARTRQAYLSEPAVYGEGVHIAAALAAETLVTQPNSPVAKKLLEHLRSEDPDRLGLPDIDRPI